MGIYKRKQISKKTRKKRTRPRKRPRKQENDQEKKKKLSWSSSCFLPCFLFFLIAFLVEFFFFLFSYFLVFFYKFPPQVFLACCVTIDTNKYVLHFYYLLWFNCIFYSSFRCASLLCMSVARKFLTLKDLIIPGKLGAKHLYKNYYNFICLSCYHNK